MRKFFILALLAISVYGAITTLDGVIAGMRPPEDWFKVGTAAEAAGVYYTAFYATGRPGAAVAPTPGLAGAALTSYSGQIPFTNPSSGNTYLARLQCSTTTAGAIILVDRLWHNSGISITTTTAQTINSVTWPARDRDGSTNGEGVMVAIEVSSATGNGSAISNTTMSYTNQSGTSGQTATISSFPATAVLGTTVPFQLAAGDTGVRSIQSLTLGTSYVSGTIHLVAVRILGRLETTLANSGASIDALTSGFPRLYDNTVPYAIFLPTATTATTQGCQVIYTQG